MVAKRLQDFCIRPFPAWSHCGPRDRALPHFPPLQPLRYHSDLDRSFSGTMSAELRARFSADAASWDANPGHVKSSQEALKAVREHVPALAQQNGDAQTGNKGRYRS